MVQNNMADNENIRSLFDLQKFIPNKRLKSLAEAVGAKYGLRGDSCCELSDDELEVWAAGDPTAGRREKKLDGAAEDYE
jgi:hypothetical protein